MNVFRVTDDVYGIDLEMFDSEVLAAYVVASDDPVLIETGYPRGIGRLRDGLEAAGVPPEDLAHAVVSHVHIDHSGGAAWLVEDNPDLSVHIHDVTADHLLNPADLTESSREAMGEYFGEMGEPKPMPAENLVRVGDRGAEIDAGDRTVALVPTPGHAPDHLAVWDPTSGVLFGNEAVGSYYPRADQFLPPATLPRFEVETVRRSIDRLREFEADRFAMSHFGCRDDPAATLTTAAETLDRFERRIPELYREYGTLAATEAAVRDELVGLDGYAEGIRAFETRFQTRGFLRHAGLL